MTHEVFNQAPPLVDHDVAADPALLAAVEREGAPWAAGDLHRLGKLAGTAEPQRWADEANRHEPRLLTHDRYGHRVDEVDFHPSWHRLMEVAVSEGLAGAAWAGTRPGAHVARAAGFYVWSQVEAGHACPVSMTYAVIPALRHAPGLSALYEPLLASRSYDPGLRTPSAKSGLLAGMGMTEKQGGSDVRANTTVATPAADGTYRLRGHKWFTSAPMCDLFLVLAQAPGGLTCFLVPRVLPDGTRNPFRIQRLKDKLGNRSNASSEPEFDDTVAWLVGGEGHGVRTIIEMVAMTRLDCVIGSASGMRAALTQAVHHTRHRRAFGGPLIGKPAMRNVLADLALESEAATALAMRLAGAVDRDEQAFKRLAIAVGKFWVCKRQPAVVGEALECLGGNGYVEESGLPRLYRDAPLNSIWEGSGNVQALDVLRTMQRSPSSLAAFMSELSESTGADRHFDAAVARFSAAVSDESDARRTVEAMALLLQASLLVRFAPPAVADAFCASRLGGDWGHTFGTLGRGADTAAIVERAAPA
ncbi:DNA alkylation response protein [Paractinoplanes abujensis]|uniref:Putative acyl-CoA dehydrogenase n=1 Tax=Paractinoplanes abujensis TaxID=882441 RepID=A0A7W7CQG9_9ACTN|nr:acyl-CoA dehydrogenase family protein [Actinoplanes abujensis]MBB4691430.1 putative acyl-CoA dehydrogenase [Actinoplanes abujensis]GID17156.1 DNA alkylation response protein [Actinoplanes abujensis]